MIPTTVTIVSINIKLTSVFNYLKKKYRITEVRKSLNKSKRRRNRNSS